MIDNKSKDAMIPAKDVCSYLGIHIHTLYRYINARKITAMKMDGGYRFKQSEVDRFEKKRTLQAA